jgi:hypothetical protein
MSWEKLADLKESHPVKTAEFAVTAAIDHEPAFNWWVPHVLKKHDHIISMVKRRSARYLKLMYKFGIEVPKTVNEAHDLNRKNGNTFWTDAIAKEMKEVHKTFKIVPDNQAVPIGYQKIPCHMILMLRWKTSSVRLG